MIWSGYTLAQWALFFFLYSFLGWVWESGYVSFREGRWVNRGFLRGPILPLYGAGAVTVLLFTLPVAQSAVLVFLAGMAGATLLEYTTGTVLERGFHTRYWDYSMHRWNFRGRICLAASLFWGLFSLAQVRLIHPFFSGWVTALPAPVAGVAALALALPAAADVLASMRGAARRHPAL